MPSKSIVSSDVEKRLIELQRNMVGMKLESRTRDNLYYDLSVALNIAFVLLQEVKDLTKPKEETVYEPYGTLAEALANGNTGDETVSDVEFTDISTGDSLSYDEPKSESDPKKVEAAKKAAETRKIRPAIFENNEIVLGSILSRIESKVTAIAGKSPLDSVAIRNRLKGQMAAAMILDNASNFGPLSHMNSSHMNRLLDNYNKELLPSLFMQDGPYRYTKVSCLFNHRRDLSRISFNDNDLDGDPGGVVILVTGCCDRNECICSVDELQSVTMYPRGWLTVKELKEKSNDKTIISKDVKVSDFEKNSFEELFKVW